MKRRVANCPACGGPVEFKLSAAVVTMCVFCRTVVARKDKRVQDVGKVADLVETGSRFYVGATGRFKKVPFEVMGRVQYQHPAGGVWDEWYLQFPGNRIQWLAEAQGKLYLTTEKHLVENTRLPDFEVLTPGGEVQLTGGIALVVAETGVATASSADGDIPWAFRPGADHRFVDLHGPQRTFATIEYRDEGPRFFFGREVAPEELSLSGEDGKLAAPPAANAAALQLNCPNCAGPLTLLVPDQTLRVSCPNCSSLLDCQQGKLQYLQTLKVKKGEKPLIPLGTVGLLEGVEYTLIGFMARYAVYEGKKYPWTEYLLYSRGVGFRWLVCNQRHWSFVEPVGLTSMPGGNEASFAGTTYRLYDRGKAYVRYVAGEFYWRVTADETVETADYIAPPYMLSFERSASSKGEELNVSHGKYVDVETLEAAFKVKDLPRPWGLGTIQPLPKRGDIWLIWLGLVGILLLLRCLPFAPASPQADGRNWYLLWSLGFVSAWPVLLLRIRSTSEQQRWKDSDYNPYAKDE